jgi:hypothetical protein
MYWAFLLSCYIQNFHLWNRLAKISVKYHYDLPPLLAQAVASKLHGTEVEVEILKKKEDCDHIQFLITQLSGPGKASRPEAAQVQTLSIGNLQQYLGKQALTWVVVLTALCRVT